MKTRLFVCLLVIVTVLSLSGCNDDDGVPPTLAEAWPDADGTSWTYELAWSVTEAPAPAIADAKSDELPSLESLRDELWREIPATPIMTDSFLYSLEFDGDTTTGSGVTAQYLSESFRSLDPVSKSASTVSQRGADDSLLRLIAAVRPDLRSTVADRLDDESLLNAAEPAMIDPTPILLAGGAFAFEGTGFYGYGDRNTDHSWVYLEGPLQAGRDFELQLMLATDPDIRLKGRIWSVRGRTIDGASYRGVAEVMYVVDLGLVQLTDEHGEPLGTARSYIYGAVFYAQGVGPIAVRERMMVPGVDSKDLSVTAYLHQKVCRLEETNTSTD